MYGVELHMRVLRSCMVDGVSIRSMTPVYGPIVGSWRTCACSLATVRLRAQKPQAQIISNATHVSDSQAHHSVRAVAIIEEIAMLLRSHRCLCTARLDALHMALTKETQVWIRADGNVLRPDVLTEAMKR